MVGTIRFTRIGRWSLTAVFAAILVMVAVACEGSAESADTVATVEPTKTVPPTVPPTEEPEPVGDLVVPVVEPDVGSDEAAILEVLERQIRALNIEDWVGFLDTCDPRLAKPVTPEKAAFIWDTNVVPFIPTGSLSRRNVGVRLFDDGTANVTSDAYSYGALAFADFSDVWVERDGEWYMTGIFCHGGNSRLK
ncbi:MAG: hypothetical protein IH867_10455 [Chloroflexi bacterium]|nr:hypothetical protein [Chloroflexota bacterium]